MSSSRIAASTRSGVTSRRWTSRCRSWTPNARSWATAVVNTNQAQGSITWNVDLTGDPAPEAFGVIQFQDDTGQPADPGFDITQFMANGLGALDQSLSLLPDGWSVSITVNAPTQPLLNSRFIYAYTSGAVSGVTGTGNIQSVSCGTTFSFNGATLAELVAAFPTIDLTSTYTGGGTTLAGGTSLAGTDIATVDGKVNGGRPPTRSQRTSAPGPSRPSRPCPGHRARVGSPSSWLLAHARAARP